MIQLVTEYLLSKQYVLFMIIGLAIVLAVSLAIPWLHSVVWAYLFFITGVWIIPAFSGLFVLLEAVMRFFVSLDLGLTLFSLDFTAEPIPVGEYSNLRVFTRTSRGESLIHGDVYSDEQVLKEITSWLKLREADRTT